jgi:hypothetical protein
MPPVAWLLFCPTSEQPISDQNETPPIQRQHPQRFPNLNFIQVLARELRPIAASTFFNKRHVFLYVTCAGIFSISVCLIINPFCTTFFGRFFHLTKNVMVEIGIELLADVVIFAVIASNTLDLW